MKDACQSSSLLTMESISNEKNLKGFVDTAIL